MLNRLLERQQGWRLSLVWRLYAWAVIQQTLLLLGPHTLPEYLAGMAAIMHVFSVSGVLILIFGPRPILWLISGISSAIMIVVISIGNSASLDFPGGEIPIFALMSLASFAIWLLHRDERDPMNTERSQIALYRWLFLVAMGFAGIHKFNTDFLDPNVSCATLLNQNVIAYWNTPVAAFAKLLTPEVVLAIELALPLLMILNWRIGLILLLPFVTGLAMIGPTGFTGIIVTLAFSFVSARDSIDFFKLGRAWILVALSVPPILVYSNSIYRGPPTMPWPQFGGYQAVVFILFVLTAVAFWRWITGSDKSRDAVLVLPKRRSARVLIIALVILFIASGMKPYLGLPYHFSFSMLSNLRVDAVRWNSSVFPPELRVWKSDPYVHVTKVIIRSASQRERDLERELVVAMFPPFEFKNRLDYHAGLGDTLDLSLSFLGQSYQLEDALQDPQFQELVSRMSDSRLYQKGLTLSGPQPCVH